MNNDEKVTLTVYNSSPNRVYKSKIYIGKKIGKLTVVEDLGFMIKEGCTVPRHYYKCKCDCGGESIVDNSELNAGRATSCGKCVYNESIGKKYNSLTILRVYPGRVPGKIECDCKCDCGNVKTGMLLANVTHGKSTTCGMCESYRLVNKKINHLKVVEVCPPKTFPNINYTMVRCECDCGNEDALKIATSMTSDHAPQYCGKCYHGLPDSYKPEVNRICQILGDRYDDIVQRTRNPKSETFYMYGGRGIKLRFDSRYDFVKSFYKDPMFKPELECDRINNDDDYRIDNIRWVDRDINICNTITYSINTYDTISRRLLAPLGFTYAVNRNNWDRKDFIKVRFNDGYFPDRDTSLYIHNSVINDITYYIDRIKGFYDEFNGNITIEPFIYDEFVNEVLESIRLKTFKETTKISYNRFLEIFKELCNDNPKYKYLDTKHIYDNL